ncbi:hypothetical protein DEFDS_0279 [Deferribacter desulfuricans SSM1]|uniref:Uncharacterized protein n=2 Tax=Deferribacter TaxID=53572 RepID=D3PB14_DEFDS|nr:hypothetical protein DEFDS_0279 [Deferribacter desulfuricans SSM1]
MMKIGKYRNYAITLLYLSSAYRGCSRYRYLSLQYKERENDKEGKKIYIEEMNSYMGINKLNEEIAKSHLHNRLFLSGDGKFGYIVGVFLTKLPRYDNELFYKVSLLSCPFNDNLSEAEIKMNLPMLYKNRYTKDIKVYDYLILGLFTDFQVARNFDNKIKNVFLKTKNGESVVNAFARNTGLNITENFSDHGGSEIFLPSHLGYSDPYIIEEFIKRIGKYKPVFIIKK